MVRNVIFLFLGVFLLISNLNAQGFNDPPDWGKDCNLRGGAIGRFVYPDECEDDVTVASRFGTPSKPITSGNLLCCRKHPPHIAKYVCKELVKNRGNEVTPQILGGKNVQEGEFPHMALIGYMLPGRPPILAFECGGALISDQFVLTAAHCVLNKDEKVPNRVRLGTLNKFPTGVDFNTNLTDYLVAESLVHPQYQRIKKYNDIALLRLARRVKDFTQTVYPACLDYNKIDPTTIMSIAGWGKHIKGSVNTSDVLLKAYVEAVPANDCTVFFNNGQWARNYPDGLPANQMCAKGAKNNTDADTCEGDSGGPLQLPVDKSISRVVGVTSFGKTCGYENPGIYSRVSSYLDWITNTVWPGETYKTFMSRTAK